MLRSFKLFFLAILLNLSIIPKIIPGICRKTSILVRIYLQNDFYIRIMHWELTALLEYIDPFN